MSVLNRFVNPTRFAGVADPRVERTKLHGLGDILVICVVAAIANCDTWVDIADFAKVHAAWFGRYLALPNGTPSHDTIGRVMRVISPAQFCAAANAWLAEFLGALTGETVALDGKVAAASRDRAAGKPAVHLVTAWAGTARMFLGQVATDAKSNEIEAVPRLLEMLDLEGAVVTADALNTQPKTAAAIVARGADYVLPVKRNRSKLYAAIRACFIAAGERNYAGCERVVEARRRTHGRVENREYVALPAPPNLPGFADWKGLATVGMVLREWTTPDGAPRGEVTYYIASLPPRVRRFAHAVRRHWGVENACHWSLDVIFSEDRGRMRVKNAAVNAGILRRLVLSLLNRDTSTSLGNRRKRRHAALDLAYLEAFLRKIS